MAEFRDDPYTAFHFTVEIPGLGLDGASVAAGFSEVSGLDVGAAPIEYRNGNERGGLRKLPGLPSYGDITLKRGVIGDLSLWRWITQSLRGAAERQTVMIHLLNEEHQPVMSWKLRRAWPSAYRGPELNAQVGAVAIESLTLSHESLELE